MRKLLLVFALLWPTGAWAQCTGVFPANTLCGNLSGTPAPPGAFSAQGNVFAPATTTSGDIVTYGNTSGTSLSDLPTISTSQALSLTSSATFGGTTNFTSQFEVNGVRIQFPSSADTVGGLGTAQTWSNSNNFQGTTSISNVRINAGIISVASATITGTLSTAAISISSITPVTSCAAGTVSMATLTISQGIITHC